MGYVTYFLGAGASAGVEADINRIEYFPTHGLPYMGNGIPIVSETPNVYNTFVNQMAETIYHDYIKGTAQNPDMGAVRNEYPFFKTFEKVSQELDIHTTFDTIARKYWLKSKNKDLSTLKFVMNIFFMWLQRHNNFDKRYDKFLSLIINKDKNDVNLPGEMKIITWNYDLQFEIACLSYFTNITLIDRLFKKIGTIPYNGNEAFNISKNEYEKNKFQIVRLNGIAGVLDNKGWIGSIYDTDNALKDSSNLIDRIGNFNLKNLVDFILPRQNDINQFDTGSLQFAFENSKKQLDSLEAAKNIIRETSTLIVIGYSFPYFNREIDISLLKELPTNVEIILQDINPPIAVLEDIRDRLKKTSVRIIPDSDVTKFHIPFDFQHGKFIT